jgi:hypothetical protein
MTAQPRCRNASWSSGRRSQRSLRRLKKCSQAKVARRPDTLIADRGPSPVERGRTGSKHHLIVDRSGIPLAVELTGGNRNDVAQLLPLVDGPSPTSPAPTSPMPTSVAPTSTRTRGP